MDQGGSPIIKLGLLLKTWRKPREQWWLMLMDKQRHGGRSPWWSIVIPAPSQKSWEPWEPWGAGVFICSFCGPDCFLAAVCALLLYVPICFHATLLHAAVTDENPSRWARATVPHGLTVMAFSGRASATPPHPEKSYHFHC